MAHDEQDAPHANAAEVPVVSQSEEGGRHVEARPERSAANVDWLVVSSVLAVLAVAAAVVYGRAIHSPFIFDDRMSVVENQSIVKLWPLVGEAGRNGPLTPPVDNVTAGRPLVNLSFALNYRYGALDPTSYHITNIVWHVLSALLLWALVGRTLRLPYFGGRFARSAGLLAGIVALVWELHPLQTEAVQYVSQRTELMMGFFYLATLLASLRYWTAQSPAARSGWLVVATIACALGMACKEVMVTAPVVALLFERAFIAGSFRRAVRESWSLYVGLSLGWLVLLALNYGAPRSASAGFHVGVAAPYWWLTQLQVLVMYLKLTVWPWPLVIHYELPYHRSLATVWPWLLLVTPLIIATLVLLWRNKPIGFLGACVLLVLSPTLVVPIPTEIAAERRMYLPLAALVALAIIGGYSIVEKLLRPGVEIGSNTKKGGSSPARAAAKLLVATGLVLAVVFSVIDIRRLAAYRDLLSLWQDAAIHQPDNALVLSSLGSSYTGAGRYEEAIQTLRRALEITPDSAELGIHKQLGTALHLAGRTSEAIEHLQTAVELAPDAPGVERQLGIALIQIGRPQAAVAHLQRAVEQRPNDPETRDNLGAALSNANRPLEAIACYEQALQLNPNFVGAQFNLAIAYAKADRPNNAIAAAEKARQLAIAQGAHETAAKLDAWLQGYRKEHPAP